MQSPSDPVHLIIRAKHAQRVARGYPWISITDLINPPNLTNLQPGQLAVLYDEGKRPIALGYLNPHSKIVVRLLSLNSEEKINQNFFKHRLQRAWQKRENYFFHPFYRLVNAEGDNLPGLIIDRFNDVLIIQISTSGMLHFLDFIVASLQQLFHPQAILLRTSEKMAKKENFSSETKLLFGSIPSPFQIEENNFIYLVDLIQGQKTGWYFDARVVREKISQRAQGKRILDLCCYTGGFGLLCLAHGAELVCFVDASAPALDYARLTAEYHQMLPKAKFIQNDVFKALADLQADHEKFDLIICDPPPFIRSAKDKAQGLKGYSKLAYGCAQLLAESGELLIASCSHHAKRKEFKQAVFQGLARAKIDADLLEDFSADRDHPSHPQLPQSDYFKAILLARMPGLL